MKGVVLRVKGTEEYIRYAHSDSPEVDEVPIDKATVFWPEEMEEGFEEDLIYMTTRVQGEEVEAVEVEVNITV